jgi:hypothetical protein
MSDWHVAYAASSYGREVVINNTKACFHRWIALKDEIVGILEFEDGSIAYYPASYIKFETNPNA